MASHSSVILFTVLLQRRIQMVGYGAMALELTVGTKWRLPRRGGGQGGGEPLAKRSTFVFTINIIVTSCFNALHTVVVWSKLAAAPSSN